MNMLGNEAEEKLEKKHGDFNEPAIMREEQEEIPLPKAIAISTLGHPTVLGLIWLFIKGLILLLAILGISLSLFDKPEPKTRDIEFILVNKPEQTPINKNTKYRADRNSRAGGKHDKKRKVSDPEPASAKSVPQKKATPPPQKKVQKPTTQKPAMPKPKPVPPKPSPKKAIPRPKVTTQNTFPIPVPITKAPKTISPQGGPVTSAPLGASQPNQAPAPVMSASGYSNPGRNKYSSGYSPSGGNAGNPSPGNPGGAPGVDAIKEPDFGPYMRELQRRIKRNWDPPKGNESKRVVMLFKIAKDGRLLDVKVVTSSGVPAADRAAAAAVELTAPFRPLPPEYRGSDIDIQFTFDYNVFGIGGGRY